MFKKVIFTITIFLISSHNLFAFDDDACKKFEEFSLTNNAKEWINIDIDFLRTLPDLDPVKLTTYQVLPTKKFLATLKLKEKESVQLPYTSTAKFYAGSHYKSLDGTTPYLVRGAMNSYNGKVSTVWLSKTEELFVAFFSMSSCENYDYLPLVVNLPNRPKKVNVFADRDIQF